MLEIEGRTISLSKGQGMILYPGIPHRYFPIMEPWTVQWVEFNGNFAAPFLQSLDFHESTVFFITKPEIFQARINEINHLFSIRKHGSSYDGSQLLYGLLLDLFRYHSSSDTRSNHEQYEHLKPVIDFIENHFDQPITLQNLANQLAVTPHYMCVLFQQTIGARPFEYINRFRIQRAKEYLQQFPEWEIQTITRKVGFESPSYFIKVFKKNEGITPNDFRKMHTIR
ncbi:AraC family transcriptional regulator [Paenibacillus sp. N3.4]|nr:AraC family transcriptional regulator [Paenibacillus sp. N3.4]